MTEMEYQGYQGTIEAELESGTLYGKVAHIRDLITYEASTLPELEKEFHFSVDEYLQDCKQLGKEPDKPYKGVFNVRVSPELHRALAMRAQSSHMKLNEYVKDVLSHAV